MIAEPKRRTYYAPALEKGLAILETLASTGGPMTLAKPTATLDRTSGELFRIVQVLQQNGYISPRCKGEGFELSDRLVGLGTTVMERAAPRMP